MLHIEVWESGVVPVIKDKVQPDGNQDWRPWMAFSANALWAKPNELLWIGSIGLCRSTYRVCERSYITSSSRDCLLSLNGYVVFKESESKTE